MSIYDRFNKRLDNALAEQEGRPVPHPDLAPFINVAVRSESIRSESVSVEDLTAYRIRTWGRHSYMDSGPRRFRVTAVFHVMLGRRRYLSWLVTTRSDLGQAFTGGRFTEDEMVQALGPWDEESYEDLGLDLRIDGLA